MRILRGYQEGRAALTRRPSLEAELPPAALEWTQAAFGAQLSAAEAVRRIVADVREQGDAAVDRYALLLDGASPERLEAPRNKWLAAVESLPAHLTDALRTAAERIRRFQQSALPKGWRDTEEGYGELLIPLERVGLYVPGGTASYPSTVLMDAIPARIAGVREIIVCTPRPDPVTLAAAHIAGVDRLFQIGVPRRLQLWRSGRRVSRGWTRFAARAASL